MPQTSCIGIMRANRLANDDERAYAWTTLMASTHPTDAGAIQHACDAFCDRVAYRLAQESSEDAR